LKKTLKKQRKNLTKEPLVYFGVFSFLLLSVIIFTGARLTIKSAFFNGDFSFLTADASSKICTQACSNDLFLDPAKNISKESPEMAFLQGNSLKGIIPPVVITPQVLGSLMGSVEYEESVKKTITEYIVEPGDSVSSVAAKFGVSANTILWANDLSKGSVLKTGQKLVILPVTGVVYHVKNGDTIGAVAKTYKGKTEEIIAFNELSGEGDIFIGDILIIPNGEIPVKAKPSSIAQPQVPIGSSYFICPNSSCKITQGLHWYNAIDFKGSCGDPVFASAAGVVQKVKYGWNGGGGNTITVLHPNGVVTGYGHISASLVTPGQSVSQGQIIATIGGKPGTPGAGISTGCHIHFSVTGARNPFAK
jgi:LysM repeat protein